MSTLSFRHCAVFLVVVVAFGAEPVSASSPVEDLRTLHQKVLRAHRESNVEMLLEDESEAYVVASRGDITRPTIAERRARLGPYLKSTVFSEYRDLVDPVVTVSADGTMGWVVVQVKAVGIQTDASGKKEPVEFVCAWIELYEKRGDRWLRTGNVSNFKP